MPNQHDMLHQLHHHNHNTVQGIAKIKTKDAGGNAKPDIGEVEEQSHTRLLLSSSSQQISLSQVPPPPHNSFEISHENDNGLASKQFMYTVKNCKNYDKRSFVTPRQGFSQSAPTNQANEEDIGYQRDIVAQNSQTCDGSLGSIVAQKSLKNKTGHSDAQPQLSSKELSNIYGGVGEGEFGFVGSWALQRKSGNMQSESQCDSVFHSDLMETGENRQMLNNLIKEDTENRDMKCDQGTKMASSNVKAMPTGSQWQFQASGGTLLQIRANHLVKLMCVMVLALAVFSVVFHSRIKVLEEEKKTLLNEMGTIRMHMQLLANKMEDVILLAIPPRSQQRDLTTYENEEDEQEVLMEMEHSRTKRSLSNNYSGGVQEKKKIVKRAAVPSRATKELMYTSDPVTLNSLNNESTTSSFGPKFDDWTVDKSRTSKGNDRNKISFSPKKLMRRLVRKERRLHLELKELKQKVKQIQQHNRLANLSCCNNNGTSLSTTHSSDSGENPRAVYLQIDGSSVNIKKPRQLIGPWYLPNAGNDIGFNGMWYNHVKLDSNGTSVIFQENGLFLISAQVFYKLQHTHNAKPIPMGFRIHIKKNGNANQIRRLLTIAECVPSFPSTIYQTCFTQAVWYVEPQDEMYVEHFTDSLPMIEALKPGQTFLGLVRLN